MSIDFNQNYFQLFQIECSVLIDHEVLEKKYLSFQKNFHPDKYVNGSDQEKRISLQITSYINEAYQTLKNDYLKSIYLLKIKGFEVDDQNNTISDSEFLMHQMELREESEEIQLKQDIKSNENFILKIKNLKEGCLKNFEKNYNKNLYDEASSKIKEMKFYTSIENDFKRNL